MAVPRGRKLRGRADAYISVLDQNGDFVSAKQFGGGSYISGNAIALNENNEIFVMGTFTDTADLDPGANTYEVISTGNTDLYVMKLADSSIVGLDDINSNEEGIHVFPNPNNGLFTIKFDSPVNGVIQVYNVLGSSVHNEVINNQSTIDVKLSDQLLNGVYLVQFVDVDSSRLNQRIVIKRE